MTEPELPEARRGHEGGARGGRTPVDLEGGAEAGLRDAMG